MSPEVPLAPDLLWEGLHLLSLQLRMGLPWTSRQHLTQERPPGIDRSWMGKMKMDPAGRCCLHSTSCSTRQWPAQKDHSSLTRPSLGEPPEHLSWTSPMDWVSWLDQPSLTDTMASTARIAQGLKEDEMWKRLCYQSLSIGLFYVQTPDDETGVSTWASRLKVHRDPSIFPSLLLLMASVSRNLLLPTRSCIAWVWTPKNWLGELPSMPL